MTDFYPADIPVPANFERHLQDNFDFSEIKRRINWRMLYNAGLGVKGDIAQLENEGDARFCSLKDNVSTLLTDAISRGVFVSRCVWRFLPAQSMGDEIIVYNTGEKNFAPMVFGFPRQKEGEKLCLSDFIAPASGGRMDYIGMFACTCGGGFARESKRLREAGKLADSHIINALAASVAEALAETVHEQIREQWFGSGQDEDFAFNKQRRPCGATQCSCGEFCGAKPVARGQRYSFGYPACPDMEQQQKLFEMLNPKDIGITLTESFMMEPEASVSAVVFHNPKAKFF